MPGQSDLVVHGGIESIGSGLDHDDIDSPDLVADVEHLIPRPAAVPRPEYAALGVVREQAAHGRDIDDVGILRMGGQPGDVVRIAQAHVRPGLARVRRFIDPIAGIRAPGAVSFARPGPDDVRVRRGDGKGSDGELGLAVEDRFERRAGVYRLPHAAVPRPDIEGVEVFFERGGGDGEGCHPRAGAERSEVAEGETFQ